RGFRETRSLNESQSEFSELNILLPRWAYLSYGMYSNLPRKLGHLRRWRSLRVLNPVGGEVVRYSSVWMPGLSFTLSLTQPSLRELRSILLNRAQLAVSRQRSRGLSMQAGENVPLQVLFWQVCRMLALPVTPIYVFDGPGRPEMKRNQKVKTEPHALTHAYQELINRAGFHFYVAPGEAEAELAQLNKANEIDAVLTDDVDALAFGACQVIRIPNTAKDGDYISIYTSAALRQNPAVSLSASQMIFIAVLSGGDYDTEGLTGCGIGTAFRLAKSSLSHDLYIAARDLPDGELLNFLTDWRAKLRDQLTSDPDGILGRKYLSVARNVKRGFPSISVLRNYVRPLTSWSDGHLPPDMSQWGHLSPDLASLATWTEKYFSWGTSNKLTSRFRDNVWHGICIRFLLEPIDIDSALRAHISGRVVCGDFTRSDILGIMQARLGPGPPRKHPNVPGYTLKIETHSLMVNTFRLLPAEVPRPESPSERSTAIIWVPSSILHRALPEIIERYTSQSRLKASSSRTRSQPPAHLVPPPVPTVSLSPIPRAGPSALLRALDDFASSIEEHDQWRQEEHKAAEEVARSTAQRRGLRFLGFVDLT
ncbi:DNA repair protein UVH3, partial [Hypsizygus marmoreus]